MTLFDEMAVNFSGKHINKLKKLCSPLEQVFGSNYFCYFHISTKNMINFIGTNIELMQHFFDDQMQNVSPFFLRVNELKNGVYLYDSVQNEEFQTTMQQLEQKHNSRHSCIFTRQDQDGCHFYAIGVPTARKGNMGLFLNEMPLLEKFFNHFEDEMQPVLFELAQQPIHIPLDNEAIKEKELYDIPEISLDRSKKMHFLNKLDDLYSDDLKFTKREVDVIKLFLEGKPAREISELIHLSSRTVEHYLEGLKDKLCCYTKSELFESLNELNCLNLL